MPDRVGAILGMSVDRVDILRELENLKFNGVDSVILIWSIIGQTSRNVNYGKEHAEWHL